MFFFLANTLKISNFARQLRQDVILGQDSEIFAMKQLLLIG